MIEVWRALIKRTGIDRAAICRLENDTHENPIISTLNRDAASLGRRISFRVVDVGGAATGETESDIARNSATSDSYFCAGPYRPGYSGWPLQPSLRCSVV